MTRPRGSAIAGEIGWITGASARPCNAEPGSRNRVTTGLIAAFAPVAEANPGVALRGAATPVSASAAATAG
jgi:hypothetical protein